MSKCIDNRKKAKKRDGVPSGLAKRTAANTREVAAVEVKGTFDAQRFFDTLALILSEKNKLKITVKVTQREKEEEAVAAGRQTKVS